MSELTIMIVGIGIGYFWAMYRKDNITVRTVIDAREFWQQMREWDRRNQ